MGKRFHETKVHSPKDRGRVVHRATRGLTLPEAVMAVAVIASVVVLLIPLLNRVRSNALRQACANNVAGIGKAMLLYPSDYGDELPKAGGPGGSWVARTPNWRGQNRQEAYDMAADGRSGGKAAISASLYLTVKYAEKSPKLFLCPADKGATEFIPAQYGHQNAKLQDLWDFGPDPPMHVSFAYQAVYGPRVRNWPHPKCVLLADRNPWVDSPFAQARNFALFKPDLAPYNGTAAGGEAGNALQHDGEGQNVLYADCHVEFARRAFCAKDKDNIYTSYDGPDKIRGVPAKFGSVPADANDSLLVNDPAIP